MAATAQQMNAMTAVSRPRGATLDALFMWRCGAVICLMHLCDVLTTTAGLTHGLTERNPLSAYFLAHGVGTYVLAKALMVAMTLMSLSGRSRRMMTVATVATMIAVGSAVISNTANLLHF